MSEKRKKTPVSPESGKEQEKKLAMKNAGRLMILIAVTVVVFFVYRVLLDHFRPQIVLGVYMTLATVVILTYVLYNRGFSRKGVTPDMLPEDWSEEKKKEFIEDGERRLVKSRPLLILSFAFIFTFIADIFELYAIPLLQEIFGK